MVGGSAKSTTGVGICIYKSVVVSGIRADDASNDLSRFLLSSVRFHVGPLAYFLSFSSPSRPMEEANEQSLIVPISLGRLPLGRL